MPTVGGRFQLSLVKQLFDKLLLNTFREDLICCLYSQLSFILVIFLWWLQENSLCRKTPELRSLTQGTHVTESINLPAFLFLSCSHIGYFYGAWMVVLDTRLISPNVA